MLFKAAMGVVAFLATPWAVPLQESGERHLYAATSSDYMPRLREAVSSTLSGSGEKGAGAYLLNWDGEKMEKKIMETYRENGVGVKVWEHTMEVFEKICGEGGGKYEG